MKGNFGFLCMSTRIDGNYVKIYEKEEFIGENYKNILQVTKGFVPNERASRRIYNCPLNYAIEGDFISVEHIDFTVYCLSIAFGVKLVSKPYSYIDSTNITPLHLGFVEMSDIYNSYFLDNAFVFYRNHIHTDVDKIKILKNAIYLLFRAESKCNFFDENFLLLFNAIDSSYKYYKNDKPGTKGLLSFLCQKVNIDTNEYNDLLTYITNIRNAMIHEGTFLGIPFAHGSDIDNINEYLRRGVPCFLQNLLIRLIFKMLDLEVGGFLHPLSLNQTSIYIFKNSYE